MNVWIMFAVAAVLWAVASYFAGRQYTRVTRGIRRGEITKAISEMYETQEEINRRVEAEAHDPVIVIRWAIFAQQAAAWDELERRAQVVMRRFPKLLHGPMLLSTAWQEQGRIAEAEALVRKWRYWFPFDVELLTRLVEFAIARSDWPAVSKLADAMADAVPTSVHPLLLKIRACLEMNDLRRAEKILVKAEHDFPENPDLAAVWDRYEAQLAA